jgi:hypothetical protein
MNDTEKRFDAVVSLLLALPVAVLEGLTLSVVWEWFMVPLGLMSIGKAHAFGIIVMMGMFHGVSSREDDRPKLPGIVILLVGVFRCLLTLGVGWVAQSLM